ncbi:hypothetical protein [Psychromonas sp. CD1]|uniref:hypothetical protein n=1 Tax=Psychromonas sp. CD1 TaxID=1979839 RepID=UPI000B9B4EE4|nr:hypothetical protein [Psychromonas sp. CD1]
MPSAMLKRLARIEPIAKAASGKLEPSIYGVVDRVDIVDGEKVPHFIRKWKGTIGNMIATDEEPTIYFIQFVLSTTTKKATINVAFFN